MLVANVALRSLPSKKRLGLSGCAAWKVRRCSASDGYVLAGREPQGLPPAEQAAQPETCSRASRQRPFWGSPSDLALHHVPHLFTNELEKHTGGCRLWHTQGIAGLVYIIAGPDLDAPRQNRPVSPRPFVASTCSAPWISAEDKPWLLLTYEACAQDPVEDDGHLLSCKYSSQVGRRVGRFLPSLCPTLLSCQHGDLPPADTGGIFSAEWGPKIDRLARVPLGHCLQVSTCVPPAPLGVGLLSTVPGTVAWSWGLGSAPALLSWTWTAFLRSSGDVCLWLGLLASGPRLD